MYNQKLSTVTSFAFAVFGGVNLVTSIWLFQQMTSPLGRLLMVLTVVLALLTIHFGIKTILIGIDIAKLDKEIVQLEENLIERYREYLSEYDGQQMSDWLPGESRKERLVRFETAFLRSATSRAMRVIEDANQPDLSP